jgi:hypothetical protein
MDKCEPHSLGFSLFLEDLDEVSDDLLVVATQRGDKGDGLLVVIRVEIPKHHCLSLSNLVVVHHTKYGS